MRTLLKRLGVPLVIVALLIAGSAEGCGISEPPGCRQENRHWSPYPGVWLVDVFGQNCDWGNPIWGIYPDPGSRLCNNYYYVGYTESGPPGTSGAKFKGWMYWFTDACSIPANSPDPSHRIPK